MLSKRLLVGIIIVGAFLFNVLSYWHYHSNVKDDIYKNAKNITAAFDDAWKTTSYLMQYMHTHIQNTSTDTQHVQTLLHSFRNGQADVHEWSIFLFADASHHVIAANNSSHIADKNLSIAHRDYIEKTMNEPNVMHFGKPVFGVYSQKWAIPVGYGMMKKNAYQGTLVTGLVISPLVAYLQSYKTQQSVIFSLNAPAMRTQLFGESHLSHFGIHPPKASMQTAAKGLWLDYSYNTTDYISGLLRSFVITNGIYGCLVLGIILVASLSRNKALAPVRSLIRKQQCDMKNAPEEIVHIKELMNSISYLHQERDEYKQLVSRKNKEIKQALASAHLTLDYLSQRNTSHDTKKVAPFTHDTEALNNIIALSSEMHKKQSAFIHSPTLKISLAEYLNAIIGKQLMGYIFSQNINIPEAARITANEKAFIETLDYSIKLMKNNMKNLDHHYTLSVKGDEKSLCFSLTRHSSELVFSDYKQGSLPDLIYEIEHMHQPAHACKISADVTTERCNAFEVNCQNNQLYEHAIEFFAKLNQHKTSVSLTSEEVKLTMRF